MNVSDSIDNDEDDKGEFHILCRKRWTKQDTPELGSNEETFTIKRIAQLID